MSQTWRVRDKDGKVIAEGEAFTYYDVARGIDVTELGYMCDLKNGQTLEIDPPSDRESV